jgi:PAS domain S-box-containing protein
MIPGASVMSSPTTREAPAANRALDDELYAVLETMPALVWLADAEGAAVYINGRWLQYTGLSEAQALGWGWAAAVHPDDLARLTDYWRATVAAGTLGEIEGRLRRFDGEYRWFLFSAAPRRDAAGSVIGWCGANIDIDDRRRAEQVARASLGDLSLILDNVPGLVHTMKADGAVEFVSNRVLSFFGKTRDELSRDWGACVHPDDRERVVQGWSRAVTSGEPYDSRHRVIRADGVHRWLHARALPLRDHAGRIVRWYNLLVDIDDQKRAESALGDMQAKLSRAAQFATVGELAASIAHEVNQPLAALVANAHACLRWLSAAPPNIPKAVEVATRIVRDGRTAGEVVRRVRSLFQRTALPMARLDLNEVVREVLQLLEAYPARKHVLVDVALEPQLPGVLGDRVQLQQLVMNLVLNAFEALLPVSDRARQLSIRSRRAESGDVLLQIVDNGVGLADSEAAFEPFYTTKVDGMGLGLVICRSIVAAHAGTLTAARNPGSGTTFTVSLPLRPAHEA